MRLSILKIFGLVAVGGSLLQTGCLPRGGGGGTPPEAPGSNRIVAIGDIHGDLAAAESALRLAGAIDDRSRWIGGKLVIVQTGDILDRGDDEEAILELFRRLGEEARKSGGDVHVLNGNHELMNAYQDFRYVTEGGFRDFDDAARVDPSDSILAALPPEERARAAAFRPGGPMALELARHPTALVLGPNLFVHGGILPIHVEMGLDAMNRAVRRWLRNEAPQPEWIRGDQSPVWTRLYSSEPNTSACDTLRMVLDSLGVERMVVGHTVQTGGITSYCGGRVWAIDVGMSSHYGGRPEVLEIRGEMVRSRW